MLFDATIYYMWAFGSDLPGLRLASLVFNRSRHRPGFISSAWYRFQVLSLVDLWQRKNRSYSMLK